LIEGEDPTLYEELLARVGAAVEPIDIIDWLLLKDVVALTWEIQRSRRHRETVVRLGRLDAMTEILDQAMPREGMILDEDRADETHRLAARWLAGDARATKRALALMQAAGFTLDDVAANSLTVRAQTLECIDNQAQRQEERRDALLQQIERRRAG